MAVFWEQFFGQIKQTGWIEFIAVIAGIVSVWCSRRESILLYPIGLINTTFYVYISIDGSLPGEASVNLYYTIMSIYGWIWWSKKDTSKQLVLHITGSTKAEWKKQLLFFVSIYLVLFFALRFLKTNFAPDAIPWADAFASASAYTGMWLMARKKTESWIWWIITNIASIPLYYTKGFAFTSVYYIILLGMAIAGFIEWKKREKLTHAG
ncbi:MAG: nicotinamide riboside transporter PnuC [Ferruginibacter sp.]